MRIALDAMGGDRAPEVPVRGALEAFAHPQNDLILDLLEPVLDRDRPEYHRLEAFPETTTYGGAPLLGVNGVEAPIA
ncbi:MAG: hypothetical protein ACREKI_01890 [Gemmatimonadota bacterium]